MLSPLISKKLRQVYARPVRSSGFFYLESPMRLFLPLLLSIHLLAPLSVWAEEMKAKNPLDYSLSQYGLVLGIALLGGAVSWAGKVRAGDLPVWSMSHLVGELATSSLAGLICFWLCEWAGVSPLLTAALTGICGHMGTRGLAMFEEWAQKRFGNLDAKG
jgi:hypothetical protein